MPYNDARIRAGKLRHRIELVAPYGQSTDVYGGISLSSTSPVATVWARIEAIQGKEALAAAAFSSLTTHKITIRYRDGITSQMMVWFKGRQFQILATLNPDELRHTLYLLCVEVNDSTQQTTAQPSGLD